MLSQLCKKLFVHHNSIYCKFSTSICQRSSVKSTQSSLLISGKRAEDTFVVVNPHLDFDYRFENFNELEENLKRRNLNFNLNEMKESWEFYKEWNDKKNKLQENLTEAKKLFNKLQGAEKNENNTKELEKLERYKSLLKEELSNVKKNVWSLEDNVLSELLKLPSVLHPLVPEVEEELFSFHGETIKNISDHLEIGEALNCLEYYNKFVYFLKNEATMFELAATDMFISKFRSQGFVRFSNPDFTRNVLAEGVGVAPDNTSELFLLEDTESNNDHLHLCGGASIFPFCGYHAKQSVPQHSLPLRYITSGRRYNPSPGSMQGLYSVNQSTSVEIFVATQDEEGLHKEFQACVKTFANVFNFLGLRFKIVSQTPENFKTWESLRASVQVYSPYHKVFVEVGSVGLVGDFISKRLRMCYSAKNSEPFLQVLSGTVVNVQTLLALCLERSQNKLFIPDVIKEFMIK